LNGIPGALGKPAQKSPTSDKDLFLKNLLSSMSLEEKVGQLAQFTSDMDQTGPVLNPNYLKMVREGKVGSVFNAFTPEFTTQLQNIALQSPHKIPLLLAYDVIHGHRTIFPIPLAEAASWDLEAMQETAQIAAHEASADGLHWTFSPMVDISRDPRWGRVAEGAGEDPFLGSAIAQAKVHGYQGNYNKAVDSHSILACVKHFALYGAVQGGRDYNSVDMSRRSMFETYFPPYLAAVQAGAASVMTAFNDVDGIPATANTWLLQNVLRKLWDFKGILVTDYSAIHELINHGVAEDGKKATYLAMRASVDMDMQGGDYLQYLPTLVKEKWISPQQIDAATLRVLSAKYDLGLFQDPYRQVSRQYADQILMRPEHLQKAKIMAEKSIVLLKNKENLLPLKDHLKIAMIGPFVKNQRDMIGNWSAAGDWHRALSLWQGMEPLAASHDWHLDYEKGANITDDPELLQRLNAHGGQIEIDPLAPALLRENAIRLAEKSDVIIAALGESQGMSGEAASRSDLGLPSNQSELLRALVATGKPVVLVLTNGRPLTLSWENENVAAIVETWFLGTQAGPAIASILSGAANPSGHLTMSFPRNVGQIPIYYSGKSTGRPFDPNNKYSSKYLDVPNNPLYPFGYGLSYTNFVYSEISLNKKTINQKENLLANITVTNVGSRAGDEVVQMYLRDVFASVTRPVMELKGFQRIHLEPGQSKKVSFTIKPQLLEVLDADLKKTLEPGEFRIFIGTDSVHLKESSFELQLTK